MPATGTDPAERMRGERCCEALPIVVRSSIDACVADSCSFLASDKLSDPAFQDAA
jgi:hypothetical protein